jgi:hypothetical protein
MKKMQKKPWYKQPSTWTGIAALAGVGSGWASGEIEGSHALIGAIVSTLLSLFPENKTIRKKD